MRRGVRLKLDRSRRFRNIILFFREGCYRTTAFAGKDPTGSGSQQISSPGWLMPIADKGHCGPLRPIAAIAAKWLGRVVPEDHDRAIRKIYGLQTTE